MPATKKASAPAAAAKGVKKAAPTPKPTAKKAATKTSTVTKAGSKPGSTTDSSKRTSKSTMPAVTPKKPSNAAPVKAESLLTSFKNFVPFPLKKCEEYMNDIQIELFRAILHAWKRELMEEVDRTMHYMQDEAANFPDPNDHTTQESDFSLELRDR